MLKKVFSNMMPAMSVSIDEESGWTEPDGRKLDKS